MSVLLLDRLMVHYEVLGRGRPVLFLHTWVGSWRYWMPAMQAASISYRAYALDLWGFGDSAKEVDRYSFDHQNALLDGLLEQLGILKVVLVGHGLGAVVAMRYAAAHPEVVDRVLATGLPLEESSITPRLKSAAPAEPSEWVTGRSPLAEAVRQEAPKTDLRAIQSSLAALPACSLQVLWKQASRPTLLLHGALDPAVLAPRQDQYADMPMQVHSIVFEQSGHYPMIDEDNKFNRLLADFLALKSGDSPRDLSIKEEWKRRVR